MLINKILGKNEINAHSLHSYIVWKKGKYNLNQDYIWRIVEALLRSSLWTRMRWTGPHNRNPIASFLSLWIKMTEFFFLKRCAWREGNLFLITILAFCLFVLEFMSCETRREYQWQLLQNSLQTWCTTTKAWGCLW